MRVMVGFQRPFGASKEESFTASTRGLRVACSTVRVTGRFQRPFGALKGCSFNAFSEGSVEGSVRFRAGGCLQRLMVLCGL